jgi:hypothetical protein
MSKKIKLDDALYDKARKHAEIAGYASVDEFVAHILGKEMAKIEEGGDSMEEIEKRLRGLGYIS